MYGVSAGLDLSAFPGREVVQVAFGQHDLQVRLQPEGCLSVEGRFELFAPDGELIEAAMASETLDSAALPRLVTQQIISATAEPPSSVLFVFSAGHRLRLLDSSSQYESFQLEPGPIIV